MQTNKNKKLLVSLALGVVVASTFTACRKGPEPLIKEGKFDFSVTYAVDGEQTTVSSTYVCKFAKSGWGLDGWYIDWDEYMEDKELANRLEQTNGYLLLKTVDDGEIYLDLNLSARSFMADPRVYYDIDEGEPLVVAPRLFIEYSYDKYEEIGISYSEDAAVLEEYGVQLISYEYDAPIQNTYENLPN